MKKLLIVVDYQNDFIDGALGFDGAIDIKDAIVKKIKNHHKENQDVIFTQDTHEDDYLDKEEGKNLPVMHCVKGTHGHDIQADVKSVKKEEDLAFIKYTFPSLELGNYLKDKNYTHIELCGLVSNICVLSNAVIAKSALPNAHIVVDALATASFDSSLHEKALDVLEGIHVEVINR
ncbi:MAG: isochorismatase family cysteine hydrolase [Candidatus Izemoplasma sp.]|nr:isochorismatase family cysteine hydrolase [Candidatus Izemoplasma sp.]